MVWGLDVARFGSDRSALCKRQGSVVMEPVKVWKGLDLMQLTGAVVSEYKDTLQSERPREIYVDDGLQNPKPKPKSKDGHKRGK